MKIAMIGQKGIPSRAGGVEIHVEELAAGLVEAGAVVDVYCRKYYCKNKIKKHRGINLYYIPTINTKHLDAIIYTFLATITALVKGYDIYHYHACGPSSLSWIPKLFGKKVVCTTHGMDWKRAKWGVIAHSYLKMGERVIASCADRVIVLNKPMQDYFYNTYKRNTDIIPNGVQENKLVPAQMIKDKWGLEKESYLLFLGRLVPEKGVHYLIEAYKQLNLNKKLVIAGGSSHSDDYVEQLAAMSIDNDNIIMTGFVSGQLLEELYSNTFLYILPSDVEGLPISLSEAMSYGRCCLVSDIKENVTTGEDKVFVFQQSNIEDLSNRLKEISQLPIEVVRKKGEEAGKIVGEKYRWSTVAKETLQVYHTLEKKQVKEELVKSSENHKKEIQKRLRIEFPMDICRILGVNILVTNMEQTVSFIEQNIKKLRGEYVCVSNGHTTVMSYEDEEYCRIQNEAVMALPDGDPLSIVSRKRGFKEAKRVTGPDLMKEMFERGNEGNGLSHYFYGGSQETIDTLQDILKKTYPGLKVVGMYSPPYRPLSEKEDQEVIRCINNCKPDIIWVGLGAPKQERWMYEHRGKVEGLMLGVGAGFDYHTGKIKRAPVWMQKMCLEWFMRLIQDPKRLWKRYLVTNVKFIWYVLREK